MTINKSGAPQRRADPPPGRDRPSPVPRGTPPLPESHHLRDGFESEEKAEEPVDAGLSEHRISTDRRGRTRVELGSGHNKVAVSRGQGRVTLAAADQTVTLTPEQSQRVIIDGGAGDDTVTLGEGVGPEVQVRGGPGNDHLIGNALDNNLFGGAGDDTLEGGDGGGL